MERNSKRDSREDRREGMNKEILKKVYEDGQLFGSRVDFEDYYKEEFNTREDEEGK